MQLKKIPILITCFFMLSLSSQLNSFDIRRDKISLIPMIKDAIKLRNSDLKILSSPWSPPFWMKTNNQMNNGGKLKKEFQSTWA